jgi:hypothetical protein
MPPSTERQIAERKYPQVMGGVGFKTPLPPEDRRGCFFFPTPSAGRID